MTFLRWVLISFLISAIGMAATLHGVQLPDVEKINEKQLVLNGLGTRLATFLGFKVKVYVAGLYVEKKTKNAEEILASDSPKKIVMEFLRDVSKEKIVKSWQEAFEKNCKDKCTTHLVHLQKFLSRLNELHEKDRMTLIFWPDRLEFQQSRQNVEIISNADFSNIILSVFIGPNPPNSELRNGLLGL